MNDDAEEEMIKFFGKKSFIAIHEGTVNISDFLSLIRSSTAASSSYKYIRPIVRVEIFISNSNSWLSLSNYRYYIAMFTYFSLTYSQEPYRDICMAENKTGITDA